MSTAYPSMLEELRAENARLRVIGSLPASAWPALLEALHHVNGGASWVATSRDTISNFEARRILEWWNIGTRTELQIGGFKAIKYEGFQVQQGEERYAMLVIDFGDVRAALR